MNTTQYFYKTRWLLVYHMCCKNVILRVLNYRETDVKKNYYFPKKVFRIIYKKKEDGDYNDSYLFPGRTRPAGITNIVMSMGEKKTCSVGRVYGGRHTTRERWRPTDFNGM